MKHKLRFILNVSLLTNDHFIHLTKQDQNLSWSNFQNAPRRKTCENIY